MMKLLDIRLTRFAERPNPTCKDAHFAKRILNPMMSHGLTTLKNVRKL
jgi:hypothetical protein